MKRILLVLVIVTSLAALAAVGYWAYGYFHQPVEPPAQPTSIVVHGVVTNPQPTETTPPTEPEGIKDNSHLTLGIIRDSKLGWHQEGNDFIVEFNGGDYFNAGGYIAEIKERVIILEDFSRVEKLPFYIAEDVTILQTENGSRFTVKKDGATLPAKEIRFTDLRVGDMLQIRIRLGADNRLEIVWILKIQY